MITLFRDITPEEMLGLLASPCPKGGWWYLDQTGAIVGVDDGIPMERPVCNNTLSLVLQERPEMPFVPKKDKSNRRRYHVPEGRCAKF